MGWGDTEEVKTTENIPEQQNQEFSDNLKKVTDIVTKTPEQADEKLYPLLNDNFEKWLKMLWSTPDGKSTLESLKTSITTGLTKNLDEKNKGAIQDLLNFINGSITAKTPVAPVIAANTEAKAEQKIIKDNLQTFQNSEIFNKLPKNIKNKINTITSLTEKGSAREEEIAALKKSIEKNTTEITRLEAENTEKEKTIEENNIDIKSTKGKTFNDIQKWLRNENTKLQNEINNNNEILNWSGRYGGWLKNEVADQESRLTKSTNQSNNKTEKNDSKIAKITTLLDEEIVKIRSERDIKIEQGSSLHNQDAKNALTKEIEDTNKDIANLNTAKDMIVNLSKAPDKVEKTTPVEVAKTTPAATTTEIKVDAKADAEAKAEAEATKTEVPSNTDILNKDTDKTDKIDVKNRNEKNGNSKFNDITTLVKIDGTDTQDVKTKKAELITLLNAWNLKWFQIKVWTKEDWLLWPKTLAATQKYLGGTPVEEVKIKKEKKIENKKTQEKDEKKNNSEEKLTFEDLSKIDIKNLWTFNSNTFVFNDWLEKKEKKDNKRTYITVNDKKYYKYTDDITGLCYDVDTTPDGFKTLALWEYKNGKMDGQVKTIYSNGDIKQAEYKKGKRSGTSKYIYPSGSTTKGEYTFGQYYTPTKYEANKTLIKKIKLGNTDTIKKDGVNSLLTSFGQTTKFTYTGDAFIFDNGKNGVNKILTIPVKEKDTDSLDPSNAFVKAGKLANEINYIKSINSINSTTQPNTIYFNPLGADIVQSTTPTANAKDIKILTNISKTYWISPKDLSKWLA